MTEPRSEDAGRLGECARSRRSACLLPGRIRLSAIAPDRRVGTRLSRAPDVAGCV